MRYIIFLLVFVSFQQLMAKAKCETVAPAPNCSFHMASNLLETGQFEINLKELFSNYSGDDWSVQEMYSFGFEDVDSPLSYVKKMFKSFDLKLSKGLRMLSVSENGIFLVNQCESDCVKILRVCAGGVKELCSDVRIFLRGMPEPVIVKVETQVVNTRGVAAPRVKSTILYDDIFCQQKQESAEILDKKESEEATAVLLPSI